MKILGWDPMATLKFRRIGCSGTTSATSYLRINKNTPHNNQQCCQQGSFALIKQLFWKIRAKWKQYCLKRQLKVTAVNYSYDPQSYSQNFDNGRSLDHPSPFAP